MSSPKFTAMHYNAVAKDIREELRPVLGVNRSKENFARSDALIKLALKLAHRFSDDNELFNPLEFLDACSPRPELYPISELWEEYLSVG